jgi:hypothetical protein
MTKIAKTNAFKKLCIDFFVSFAPPSLKTRTAGYKLSASNALRTCLITTATLAISSLILALILTDRCPLKWLKSGSPTI